MDHLEGGDNIMSWPEGGHLKDTGHLGVCETVHQSPVIRITQPCLFH